MNLNNNFDDYILINNNNTNKLIPGGYIRYIDRHNRFNYGGILISFKFPVLKLKSFKSNKIWRINILENTIYYKNHVSSSYKKLFTHLLNGLENKTIEFEQ